LVIESSEPPAHLARQGLSKVLPLKQTLLSSLVHTHSSVCGGSVGGRVFGAGDGDGGGLSLQAPWVIVSSA
jgi:hypothetical protein